MKMWISYSDDTYWLHLDEPKPEVDSWISTTEIPLEDLTGNMLGKSTKIELNDLEVAEIEWEIVGTPKITTLPDKFKTDVELDFDLDIFDASEGEPTL